MRTTIELPDDLHQLARQLAHETNRSMSVVVADLIRLGLTRSRASVGPGRSSVRGMPAVSVGRPITAEDVRCLDDDE